MTQNDFNILIVAQGGRLEYEAVLFLASLRKYSPQFKGRVFVAEPTQSQRWGYNPGIKSDEVRKLLTSLDANIVSFESHHFGESYPFGNKIEALSVLPEGENFVFFDTDTLILDELSDVPFDFNRPSASLVREGTWPIIELYGPGYEEIWGSLYKMFELDFLSSQDSAFPPEYWQRYLYFNAGFFYFKCPKIFGDLFLHYATRIRNEPPEALVCQSLDPWLDQIALPLVVHALGGGKDALQPGFLDGKVSCHYRVLSLLYARESDETVDRLHEVTAPHRVKKVLKEYEPLKRLVYQKRGMKLRGMFDRAQLPRKERALRNKIKSAGFWMR